MLLGIPLSYFSRKYLRTFGLVIGAITGNYFFYMMESVLLYRYNHVIEKGKLIELVGFISVFTAIAIIFHYHVFNYMISFCGSFLIVKGINIAWNSSLNIGLMNFVFQHGFTKTTLMPEVGIFEGSDEIKGQPNNFTIWFPIFHVIAVFVLFIISVCIKAKLVYKD